MSENKLTATVRRISPMACAIDIHGDISSFTETALVEAYNQALQQKVHTILFNFTGLTYMNSFGIGMLVTLLIRARREGKNIVAYGLNDHYRNIFSITRIDQAIPVYESEQVALAYAEPMDMPERES